MRHYLMIFGEEYLSVNLVSTYLMQWGHMNKTALNMKKKNEVKELKNPHQKQNQCSILPLYAKAQKTPKFVGLKV